MKMRTLMHGVLVLYLAGLFVLWFFSTDYLGEVPTKFAAEIGLTEFQVEVRRLFYRDYIF